MPLSNSIYISYSWKVEDKNDTVEKLLTAFSENGIEVKRDLNVINYGDSIRAYMDELATGGVIILVLSESYFKSPNCMYELRELYHNNRKEFRKRIFPVVLQGTKFHQAIDRIPYIRHWGEETKKLKDEINTVSREDISAGSHQELRDYSDFRRIIDELLALIGDMNHLTEEEHLENGFSALIERLFSQPALDEGDGKDKTCPEKAVGNQASDIGQNIIGNSNISSGSGNVIVNNINVQTAGMKQSPEKAHLRSNGNKPKIEYNIPELPPNYLPRKEYLEEFRAALQQESIGLTGAAHVGVQGMGGLGKSVLAIALALDEDVQAAFADGIFWLTFGQEVGNDDLLAWQNTLLKLLGQQEPEDALDLGRHRLNTALRDKRCLFIIDDIWDSRHLNSFDLSGTDCRFLLTSRKADVLERLGIDGKPIALLSEDQALAMLARYSAYSPDELPAEAVEIVRECGYLPLAVAAIGSMVKRKPADRWQLALSKLQEAKLDKISFKFDYQYENLFRALQVSVEALPAATQKYYATLAVFPEDVMIPESVLKLYWEYCAFNDDYPQDVIDDLLDASLLTRVDDNSVQLHDLLLDYLFKQAENIAELHRQLLESYKAAYPGGWHTIPYAEPYYFYKYWLIHAEAAGETAQVSAIADALIRYQPLLNYRTLLTCLKNVDYQLAEVAPHLLKTNQHPEVLAACLRASGKDAKEDARRLLKINEHPNVLAACLKILGDEAKDDARRLLKESQDSYVIVSCLTILEDEAKDDARRLLKESQDSYVIGTCLKILKDEAKDDARRLLKESQDSYVIGTCLKILKDEAKDDARRLLKESQDSYVIVSCLTILEDEAKDDARRLLKESQDSYVIGTCLKILKDEAKDDARRLLKESQDSYVIVSCLTILEDEAKDNARRLLKESQDDIVLSSCLQLLGKRAKKIARQLLGNNRHPELVVSCLRILEEEAKEEVKVLLKENDNPHVQAACLKAIGMDAKDDAKRLLVETQNPELRSACLMLLGDEVKEEAREFLNTAENSSLITACLKVLNDDARDDAKHLLQTNPNPLVVTTCLQVLGGEAKEEARCLLKESQNSFILRECMHILGNEAKKDARRLLKSSENEYIIVACIEALGKEAKVEAERLIKTSNNRFIRKECRELIYSWETSLGSKFPELAQLKKKLENK